MVFCGFSGFNRFAFVCLMKTPVFSGFPLVSQLCSPELVSFLKFHEFVIETQMFLVVLWFHTYFHQM